MRERVAIIDFETRSAASLRTCGTWRYAEDPSTEVTCLAFRLPHWKPGVTDLWHPDFPHLGVYESEDIDGLLELFDWILDGRAVEAHNAWFERCVWQHQMLKRGWPTIHGGQWRCSAAKAAAHALPRGLDDALAAAGLAIRKDAEGSKVMKKSTKPRKPRKAEREEWQASHGHLPHKRLYHEDRDLLERLWAYCRQDVLAEEALGHFLDDLSPEEQVIYQLDQTVNERGFQIDLDAVSAALALIKQEQLRFNKELVTLTGGAVQKATQRAQMLEWFQSKGLYLEDTQKATLDEQLQRPDLDATTRRGLYLVRALGRSSTAKYTTMAAQASRLDARVRGGLLYHGATTGRWSGSGVQPHNFPKGTLKDAKDPDALWTLIKRRSRTAICRQYPDVMEVLSHALRGAITATPGRVLYVADYASIEARVLLWLAQDDAALDVFRSGQDIYLDMASAIYGYACTKADHPAERALGKVAILGLGYQMGVDKFRDTAGLAGITIDDEMAATVVEAYRSKYWRVKQLWRDQEAAAVDAVRLRRRVSAGPVVWFMAGRFLYCQLPSGRRIAYPDPKIQTKRMSWGEDKPSLTFMGMNTYTRKWERQHTYGGKLVENIDQAVSRDLMAAAMLRCERSGIYQPVLSVHDEMIAEADEGTGNVHEFEQLMAECPPWATGLPVAAEGWTGFRYRK